METKEKILEIEQKYLEIVKEVINRLIEDANVSIDDRMENINEEKKFMWERLSEYTDEERAIALYEVDNKVSLTNKSIEEVFKLEKTKGSPYFAKLIFKQEKYDDEFPIYIGMTSVSESLNFYVFDWRAPISSLFYNYELGDAKYDAPVGEIIGEIIEKMQFKIIDGELVRCFDSDVNIGDEYLQEVLSKATTDKMKNIVSTIQREQNEIIRNEKDKYLIVQGVAGSGKTSVALHRIAYLLYRDLSLTSNNVLIFSPNEVFSDYISEVLPEMGEENVMKSTLSEFSSSFLKPYQNVESYSEFLSRAYNETTLNDKTIKYKMSYQYQKDIKEFMENYTSSISFKNGITHNNVEVSASQLRSLYNKVSHFSLKERFEYVIEETGHLLGIPNKKYRVAIKNVLLENSNINFNFMELYQKFLEDDNIQNYVPKLNKREISYEDITGLLYMYFTINGYPIYNHIRQVVIDEVQDYTPFQLELIKKIFNRASFTILGDIHQTINPYHAYESLETLTSIYDNNAKYIELTRTYRSSEEIIGYSNEVLGINNLCAVRHNNNIQIDIKDVPADELLETIKNDMATMNELRLSKLAIITRDITQAKELYKRFEDAGMEIQLVISSDSKIIASKIIIPSYLSKGLEFESVIVYNDPSNSYIAEENNLYYVVCTRAQHKLNIYNEPEFIKVKKIEKTINL